VEFVATGGALQMKPRKRTRKMASAYDHWLAKAAGSAKKGMTTDEIMAQTRGRTNHGAGGYTTYFPKVKLICP